jgi:hypothetical protein
VGQLDPGLRLSPQRLRGHKALKSKGLFPRAQVLPGPPQLVGEYGEGLGCAVLVLEFGEIRFPELILPDKEDGRFRKRPAQRDVADLFT